MSIESEVLNIDKTLQRDSFGPRIRVWEESFGTLAQHLPELWRSINEQGEPVRVAIHSIEPGQQVQPHVDKLPARYVRRHYPVTAPVYWWDEENGDALLLRGEWSKPVPYWVMHSVSNPTDLVRITVIVDFNETVD